VHRPQQRSFTLRLDVDDQHIAGRLEDESGRGREFVGWLGLARALESHLNTRTTESEHPPPGDTGPE
jgi:hypothetical protein